MATGQALAQPTPPAGRARPALSVRLLAQELAVLLEAGIPLLEALEALQDKEPRPAAARALALLQAALREGRPLSDALAAQPAQFDALFVALVRANERSGTLAQALAQHARFLAWAEALRARVVGALIYPALLLVAGGAVVVFLLLFVLPRFGEVFDQRADLPWASRLLFDLSAALNAQPWPALALATVPPVLAAWAWRQPAWRDRAAAWAWRLPALGPRLQVLALATLYRALGLLLASGVTAPAALALVQTLVAAPLRAALARAAALVGQGRRLSDALESQGLATPVARRMVRVGERSGQLAAMFERAAAFHDEEIARLSDWVAQALNPLLMLLMGVVIGGIVVLMYLPIFQLMEQVP